MAARKNMVRYPCEPGRGKITMQHIHSFAEANYHRNDNVRRAHAGIWFMWASATANHPHKHQAPGCK